MSEHWLPFAPTGQVITSLPNTPDGTVWANNRYIVVVRYCGEHATTGPLIWLSIKSVDNDTGTTRAICSASRMSWWVRKPKAWNSIQQKAASSTPRTSFISGCFRTFGFRSGLVSDWCRKAPRIPCNAHSTLNTTRPT